MNTMKPILLGTALLVLASLCGQSVRADGNYTATANGVSPQSGSYPINHSGYYSVTPASIPLSVAQQSVQVNGATPSRTIYVGWDMYVRLTVHSTDGYHNAGMYLTEDYSNGVIGVPTKPDGSWQHLLNGSGSYSQTYTTTIAGSWAVDAGSSITDPAGNNNIVITEGTFTTVDQYIV